MKIVSYVRESDFVSMFNKYKYTYQFSDSGLHALYRYYDEREETTGEAITLDIADIHFRWGEYSERDLLASYGYLTGDTGPSIAQTLEALRSKTTVITIRQPLSTDGYLVEVF